MKFKGKDLDMKFLGKVGNYIRDNGSTFTMIGSLVTLGVALYAAFKASDEVAEINDNYKEDVKVIERSDYSDEEKTKELKDLKVNRNIHYILAYKWALLFGSGSAVLIFLTKYLDGLTISGLTALAIANQEKLKDMAKNAKELLGEENFEKLEEMTLEDKVLRNFVGENGEPLAVRLDGFKGGKAIAGNYTVHDLFVDSAEGYLFQMDKDVLLEHLEWAKNDCARNHGLTEERYFGHMLIPHVDEGGRYKKWTPEKPFEAKIVEKKIFGMTVQVIEYTHQPQIYKVVHT